MRRSGSSCSVLFSVPLILAVALVGPRPFATAEPVPPSVHWGAISYPDQYPLLLGGLTVNRFTEFNGHRDRFNAIQESAGFNFFSGTWTERLPFAPDWMGNLTFGAGPTGTEPSEYLQNEFVHDLIGTRPVPIEGRRSARDFMFRGTLTRWGKLGGTHDVAFAGFGADGGSLYQEVYARAGVRRLSLAEVTNMLTGRTAPNILSGFSNFVRFSAMGRYGRLYGGAGYGSGVIASQSWIAQGSVTFADYRNRDGRPDWEFEVAIMIDSGLFVTPSGNSIERRFGSIALRFPYGVVETWNDLAGRTDSGPTYGFRLMLDLLKLCERWSS